MCPPRHHLSSPWAPIKKLSTKLNAVSNLKHTVHLPIYNQLIKDAAESFSKGIATP